jgi:hypothetical protein
MVGAGFSLNAIPTKSNVPPFPDWRALSLRLVDALYPRASTTAFDRGQAELRAASVSGSLRLGDEFIAAYGRPALDDLLAEVIRDEDYEPSSLHTILLKLPWSDVFTTNYDRLLERAASRVSERRYHIVTNALDIGSGMRPRLVKLHGSFPSGRPFVLTEEDFRQYPRRCAAMVNMAQQSIVENVFCLLGFSGDDPNFLAWTGWARDNLGDGVRQVFLCGLLNLNSAQRKLLQDRKVMPIDLSPLFPEPAWPDKVVRHAKAIEWLLLTLEAAQPINPLNWPQQASKALTSPSPGLPAIPQRQGDDVMTEDMSP